MICTRHILAYIMIPTVQREFDTFIEVVWNAHRIGEQRNTFLPDGFKSHLQLSRQIRTSGMR